MNNQEEERRRNRMEKTEYIVADPSGNITVLVLSPVDEKLRGETARRLMEEVDGAEQVGYLLSPKDEKAVIRLEMAGGEFCGNASLSTAAYYAGKNGIKTGETKVITIEVSGANRPVDCSITGIGDKLFRGSLNMPLPERISEKTLYLEGEAFTFPVVEMPGITHIIFQIKKREDEVIFETSESGKGEKERTVPPPHSKIWEKAVKKWAEDLGTDAAGILFLDRETMEMTPLVYVEVPGSICYENGCGSGTAAAGAWLASMTEEIITGADIKQPGGVISVKAEKKGKKLNNLEISGNITFRNAL